MSSGFFITPPKVDTVECNSSCEWYALVLAVHDKQKRGLCLVGGNSSTRVTRVITWLSAIK